MDVVQDVWFGTGAVPSAARLALWPLSVAYGAAAAARNRLYESGLLRTNEPDLPVLSVGNITVGGTGKTPVAAWCAAQLSSRARTAVALRGYGSDEVEVHARLNPAIPVVVGADRLAAVSEARRRGAEVVVLDDAYQHRRIARTANVLLVSAEQLARPRRLLPAGPWREPLTAARRADLIVVTRKAARETETDAVRRIVRETAPGVPDCVVWLAPDALRSVNGAETMSLERLRGAQVHAVAAIGEPLSFQRQLESLGGRVVLHAYRDHHEYSADDIAALSAAIPADALAVCTLKDAVKLAGRWAGSGTLWYLSQQLVVEDGLNHMNHLLERVLDARPTITASAG